MKKLLLSSSIIVLLLPGLAFAAFNDVSLTTDVVLSVNGITVNLSGSQATIESLVVNSANFVVTIKSGSSFQVTAPSRNKLEADTGAGHTVNTCTGTESVLGYNPTGDDVNIVVTITPSSDLCTGPTADTSGGTGSSGGGGGVATVVATTTPVTPVLLTAPLTPEAKVAAIAAIKTQLVSLIQQLIILLNQEIQKLQAKVTTY